MSPSDCRPGEALSSAGEGDTGPILMLDDHRLWWSSYFWTFYGKRYNNVILLMQVFKAVSLDTELVAC